MLLNPCVAHTLSPLDKANAEHNEAAVGIQFSVAEEQKGDDKPVDWSGTATAPEKTPVDWSGTATAPEKTPGKISQLKSFLGRKILLSIKTMRRILAALQGNHTQKWSFCSEER
jgi:hypothetical protein